MIIAPLTPNPLVIVVTTMEILRPVVKSTYTTGSSRTVQQIPIRIYAHILDEDRKVNAQKFETAFYAKPDLRNVRPPEEPAKSEPATLDLESLVEQLQKSPELASALAALIAAQAPAK